jgi:hypothetical protein
MNLNGTYDLHTGITNRPTDYETIISGVVHMHTCYYITGSSRVFFLHYITVFRHRRTLRQVHFIRWANVSAGYDTRHLLCGR